jgi:two-component system, sensor histidine kinase SagS
MCSSQGDAVCKILIVDDGDDVFDLAEAELTAIGHEVASARNGLEALQYLKKHESDPPCVVVTDLRMPVLDGWDLVYALRRQSRWVDLPIVVCSGSIDPDAAPPLLNAKAYWSRRPSRKQLQEMHQYCSRHHQSWPPFAITEDQGGKVAG